MWFVGTFLLRFSENNFGHLAVAHLDNCRRVQNTLINALDKKGFTIVVDRVDLCYDTLQELIFKVFPLLYLYHRGGRAIAKVGFVSQRCPFDRLCASSKPKLNKFELWLGQVLLCEVTFKNVPYRKGTALLKRFLGTTCHLSPPVAACHHLSPHLSPPSTACPQVTTCHHLSTLGHTSTLSEKLLQNFLFSSSP